MINEDRIILRKLLDREGIIIGEIICKASNYVIIKKSSEFYSIPISKISERFGDLVINSEIDWSEAKKLGDKWKSKFSPLEK
ncbi:MAG: hypothetical protein QMC98_02555 [Candidatus Thermoplasmatota archaeon]|nr:hypothetical protein [Candidatus Thermoplasmatota archaeon]